MRDPSFKLNLTKVPFPSVIDPSILNEVNVRQFIAFSEPGRFAGWPANSGAWIWGNELLVGFTLGYHNTDNSLGHSIRNDMPRVNAMLRSLDGGISWNMEKPENYQDSSLDIPALYKESPGFNFQHPDFALKISGQRFFVSLNRGRNWEGPYKINLEVKGEEINVLTSRTDYIIIGPDECFIFMSAENKLAESDYKDRSFCARTIDGGKTFEFLGWMTHDLINRSVMSSTVRIGENHFVSSIRRKHIQSNNNIPSKYENWIEAAESRDNGKTWTKLGKVADTDFSERNGNPPAMISLEDGKLCVAYGYRDFPYGIRMKVSKNYGKTWEKEIIIRSDGATWELGYPRMLVNSDGKIVIIYYYNTKDNFEQFIGVSIIDPGTI